MDASLRWHDDYVGEAGAPILPELVSGRGTMRSMVEGQFHRRDYPSTTLPGGPPPQDKLGEDLDPLSLDGRHLSGS
ncbi:hypothetical protein ACFB49_07840 [Sphingomonas sp. DBB INV C78]